MNKAILLIDNETCRISLSFHYYCSTLSREFNFDRSFNESLGTFITKIKSKMINAHLKEVKKNRMRSQINFSMAVKFQDSSVDIYDGIKLHDLAKYSNLTLFVEPLYYDIKINPPFVKSLKLPSSSAVNIMLYPKNLQLKFSDLTTSIFNWYISGKIKSPHKIEWDLISSGYFYTPNSNALGCKVRLECIPILDGNKGPSRSIISKECISSGPEYFPFEKRHTMCSNMPEECFRLVTYNCLASLYADTPHSRTVLYPYIPSYALSLDYRMQLIIQELLGYQSDIVCLQEIDQASFIEDLNPVFQSLGYQGVLSLKKCYFSSCSKTNSHNYKDINEGIACFVNLKKFNLKGTYDRHLFQELQSNPLLASQWDKISQNLIIKNKLRLRKNVLQINLLEYKLEPDKLLIVGNTHLYYHPEGYVQLIQAAICVTLLKQFRDEYKTMYPTKDIVVLFCGDFNSTPNTDAYKYITFKNYQDYGSLNADSKNYVNGLVFDNEFEFVSAYGTPEYTNYTTDFIGCLDYIFYSSDNIALKQVIPLPTVEEVSEHKALPSVVFPSDHLALISDFMFK